MKLSHYEGKKVVIETVNHQLFRGIVGDYIFPDDNENGKESIIIDAIGHDLPIELYEDDIKSIEITNSPIHQR